MNLDFSLLIRAVGKVSPSFKFIPSNHFSSMATIFSRNNSTLSLDVWSDCFLNDVSSKFWSNSYYPECITKPTPMIWEWSWSWHLLVVLNKCFCSRKMVLHWHCLRINIHESKHVKFKSAVMTKPLQLCIFIYIFWSFCLCFSFYNILMLHM